jgi:hypothetical protein
MIILRKSTGINSMISNMLWSTWNTAVKQEVLNVCSHVYCSYGDGFSGDDLCALSDWIGYDDASLTGQHCVNYEHAKKIIKQLLNLALQNYFNPNSKVFLE